MLGDITNEDAESLNVRSIAFPAIATSIYGFPADRAARIAVATVKAARTTVSVIRLVAFDQDTYDLLTDASRRGTGPSEHT